MSAADHPVSLAGVRSALARLGLWWPVLASALVLLVFVGAEVIGAHGNPATLVQFGRFLTRYTHPPAGAPRVPGLGYDGQLYWVQASDPLLLHSSTVARLLAINPSFSLHRPAYPALAWLLAGGRTALLPWSMLAIDVLLTLGVTAMVSRYAQRLGRSPAWGLAIGIAPGLVIGTSRDLSDVMATCALVLGLLAFNRRRPWIAGVLLAIATLSREPMLLSAVAVACALAAEAWSKRSPRGALAVFRSGWPAAALPVGAYFAWGAYLHTLTMPKIAVAGSGGSDTPIWPPFHDIYAAAEQAIRSGSTPHMLFVLPYLALVAGGALAAVWLLRRGRSAAVWMAVLYGVLVLPVIFLNDNIALTRYTVPLFACLLVAGLEHRSRSALAIAGASAAMTFLLPLLAY